MRPELKVIFITIAVLLAFVFSGQLNAAEDATSNNLIDATWVPPTTNADGTPLTDLAGYNYYCGPVAGPYTLADPADHTGLIPAGVVFPVRITPELPGATNECYVTALDGLGNESARSGLVQWWPNATPSAPTGHWIEVKVTTITTVVVPVN